MTASTPDEPALTRGGSSLDEKGARKILEAMLDDLGTAHHRPFSRG